MRRLSALVGCLAQDEAGATAVEYAILVALIAAAIVIVVFAVGEEVAMEYAKVCNEFAKVDVASAISCN